MLGFGRPRHVRVLALGQLDAAGHAHGQGFGPRCAGHDRVRAQVLHARHAHRQAAVGESHVFRAHRDQMTG